MNSNLNKVVTTSIPSLNVDCSNGACHNSMGWSEAKPYVNRYYFRSRSERVPHVKKMKRSFRAQFSVHSFSQG